MSTVKITDLPQITNLDNNTANTVMVGVDVGTDVTAKFTVTTLAEGLFHNNSLKAGKEDIIFANTIAQFSDSGTPFLQVNLQNTDKNSSGDYVATADIGTNANNFIDMGINGSTFSDPAYSAMRPLDGYLYVQGSLSNSTNGNLIIGTASTGANVIIAPGGTTTSNVVAHFTKNGLVFKNSAKVEFTDGSIQTVAAAPANYTQSAFNAANTAASNTVIIQAINLTQNTNITAVNGYAVSAYTTANGANGMAVGAYNKANNALANTSGTFAGNLNITGTIKAAGIVTLNNSTFASNTAFLSIVASDDFTTVPPSNTNYMIHVTGKANSVTRVVLDSFGANTYPLVSGRMGRGSSSNPQPTQNNDVMMRIVGNGYTPSGFKSSSPTKIDFVAHENFTNANNGTRIEFWNTPVGSNTIQEIASFNADSAEFLGVVNPQKGMIFTPRVPVGNQTTIALNFATDVIIKANLVADLTVTLSNYTSGKVVEVWLTNTSANPRTITHGCTDINSTTNSPTFTMSATSSAYLRYFSIDGNNANTFVSVQYS